MLVYCISDSSQFSYILIFAIVTNSTNVNLYGIVQYGRHWLQLCMTEALSSNLDQWLIIVSIIIV